MRPPSPPPPPPVADALLAEQARDWLVWLASGAVHEAGMRDFEQWLARPGHRRAFERERVLWRSLGPCRAGPFDPPGRMRAESRSMRPRLRRALAAAAVLALLLAAPEAWLRLQADHRSGHAVQALALPDGSRAVLDADSAIAVRFDARARRVELLRGRAWFEVAPGDRRRFSVSAADGVVEDISTAFSVERRGARVEARVGQGQVRVSSRGGDGWTYLRTGQGAVYGDGTGVTRLEGLAPEGVGAWRQGELLLEQAALTDALRLLGRYRAGPIFVRGDLSRLPAVSAALRIDRPEQALDALAASAGLQVIRLPLGVAVVRAPAR